MVTSETTGDIIPPVVYKGQTYQQNWDEAGQAIFNNGCVVPDSGTDEGTGDQTGAGDESGDGGQVDNGDTSGQQGSDPDSKEVTICHAAGNGYYVQISPNVAGVFNGHMGHDGDIIPPFSYNGELYQV